MSQYSFDTAPRIYMSRRKFDLSHEVKTSIKVGQLVPVDCVEVLPGDTFYDKTYCLARLSTTFLRPVMDNFFLDTYAFFVPYRLLFDDYERVFGNPSPGAYSDNELLEFPVTSQASNVVSGSIGDYLGLPVNGAGSGAGMEIPEGISILPFRAFALIYEEWFRNQNTVQPMLIQKGDFSDVSEALNSNPWSPSNYTGLPPSVGKLADYFTSCLPAPQKGSPVNIGTSVFPGGDFPVISKATSHGQSSSPFKLVSPSIAPDQFYNVVVSGNQQPYNSDVVADTNNPLTASKFTALYSQNQYAEIPEFSLNATNVNDLRFAFQLQKMLEKDARFGSRYREYIAGHFGVTSPDVRWEIPEFLGGKRTPLNVQQVTQTSEATTNSPLGSLGAYSQSYGRARWSKGFQEHGFVITVACIRYKHSYQQGIPKMFFRSKREDFYDPLFANLGEQPVYKRQLYGYGDIDSGLKNSVFGYNEAWAEYRYQPDTVSGQMRSNVQNTFDVWHFADVYSSNVVLSEGFTNENAEFFRRTTAVGTDSNVDDFLLQFYFDRKCLRTMPLRSVPGLIDHH